MNDISFIRANEQQKVTSVFYGLRKGERIPDGYFQNINNMTSSKFPCLATRAERARMIYQDEMIAPGEPVAAIEYNGGLMLACSNGMLMYKDNAVSVAGKAQALVLLGNNVFCSPAGVYTYGEFNNIYISNILIKGLYSVVYCDSTFSDITVKTGEKPMSPANGQYWYDEENKGLYKYSSLFSEWVAVPNIYIRISSSETDFAGLHEGDAVRITSTTETIESFINAAFENSIVVEGVFNPNIISDTTDLRIERRFPDIQHVCSHNNRIWGCNYNGVINEIYASKLGDPLNWYCYRGLSTDSYAVSCGEAGSFTGCSELGDTVVFFKENCIYTVYGSEPSNFQTVKTDCFGVQEGSEKSICKINGQLYYKSCHGIMRLSEGALPICISEDLGADIWSEAVAGTDGRKYYIVMTDLKGNREMFVYDTAYEMWHKEDLPCDGIFSFMTYKNNLLCVGKEKTEAEAKPIRVDINQSDAPKREDYENYIIWAMAVSVWTVTEGLFRYNALKWPDEKLRQYLADSKNVDISSISDAQLNDYMSTIFEMEESFEHKLTFSYITNELTCNAHLPVTTGEYEKKDEGRFYWESETGIRGLENPEYKRVQAIEIRMKLMSGSRCSVAIEYDGDGKWHDIESFDDSKQGTFRVNHRLKKCDTYRLKLYGYGQTVIFSISETYEEAGSVAI